MLEIGQILHDKYRVDRLVGKGGMGQVYEGFHLLIGRRVAIKVLLPELASSEDGAARFEREVRATARIDNDHILDVFDAGALPDGSRFMVSEFLDGETLEARLRRSPLSALETARYTLELLDGLAAAHRAGIAHRDLKPDNIFLARKAGRDDFVKIIDFGISKFQFGDDQSMGITTTGAILGTPHYFSPEQAQGERNIDQRSDLYTVGVIMYRCVAGRVPFLADNVHGLLFKIALEDAPPLDELIPGTNRGFAALVRRAMAKDRGARFQSAAEMSRALEAWRDGGGSGAPAGADTVRAKPEADGSDMLAGSAPGVTPSNVEVNTPAQPRTTRRRRAAWVVFGLAVVVASGAAAFIASQRGSPRSSSSVAREQPSSPPAQTSLPPTQVTALPSAPAASAREIPSISPSLASAPSAESSPKIAPSSRRSHPANPPARPAPTVEPPAPKPAATGRTRRDFGY